jgi:hypothetical protein
MMQAKKLNQSVSENVIEQVFGDFTMLEKKVAIYIPSTVDVDVKVDNTEMVNKTLEFLSDLFGGATATKAQGAWVSDEVGLVKEDVTIVYAYTSDFYTEKLMQVRNYAEHVRDIMGQECVSVEIDTHLFLV